MIFPFEPEHTEIFSRQMVRSLKHLIGNSLFDMDFSDSKGLLKFGNK